MIKILITELKRAMPATHVPASISCFLLQKFRGKALNPFLKLLKLSMSPELVFVSFEGG